MLFRGGACTGLTIVLHGTVLVTQSRPEVRSNMEVMEVVEEVSFTQGSFFGEAAMAGLGAETHPRLVSAVTMTSCVILQLSQADLEEVMKANSPMRRAVEEVVGKWRDVLQPASLARAWLLAPLVADSRRGTQHAAQAHALALASGGKPPAEAPEDGAVDPLWVLSSTARSRLRPQGSSLWTKRTREDELVATVVVSGKVLETVSNSDGTTWPLVHEGGSMFGEGGLLKDPTGTVEAEAAATALTVTFTSMAVDALATGMPEAYKQMAELYDRQRQATTGKAMAQLRLQGVSVESIAELPCITTTVSLEEGEAAFPTDAAWAARVLWGEVRDETCVVFPLRVSIRVLFMLSCVFTAALRSVPCALSGGVARPCRTGVVYRPGESDLICNAAAQDVAAGATVRRAARPAAGVISRPPIACDFR